MFFRLRYRLAERKKKFLMSKVKRIKTSWSSKYGTTIRHFDEFGAEIVELRVHTDDHKSK